jgi:hypothetical protein
MRVNKKQSARKKNVLPTSKNKRQILYVIHANPISPEYFPFSTKPPKLSRKLNKKI